MIEEVFSQTALEEQVERLLEKLESDRDSDRNHFLLAQAYKKLGKVGDAILWYECRIKRGGNPEELWFSRFMLGEVLSRDWGLEVCSLLVFGGV